MPPAPPNSSPCGTGVGIWCFCWSVHTRSQPSGNTEVPLSMRTVGGNRLPAPFTWDRRSKHEVQVPTRDLQHCLLFPLPLLSQERGGHAKEIVTSPTNAHKPFSFRLGNDSVPQASSEGGCRSPGDLVPVDRILGFRLELLQSKGT